MLHAYVEAVDVHWARENRLARVQSKVERMREDSLVNSGKRRSSSRGLLGRWVSQLCACLGCEAVVGMWELGWRAESGGGESLPASPAHCPLLSAYQGLRSLLRSCVGLLVSVCVQLLFFVCRRRARPRCGTAGSRRHAVQRPTQSPFALFCSNEACKHPHEVFQMGSSQRRAPYAAFLTI